MASDLKKVCSLCIVIIKTEPIIIDDMTNLRNTGLVNIGSKEEPMNPVKSVSMKKSKKFAFAIWAVIKT